MSQLTKPEKIYLGNTNYTYALGEKHTNIGNVRETFFFTQLSAKYSVTYSDQTDFVVDQKYNFEFGGRNKTTRQINGLPNTYIAMDDIEVGFNNHIPIWLFGLMY